MNGEKQRERRRASVFLTVWALCQVILVEVSGPRGGLAFRVQAPQAQKQVLSLDGLPFLADVMEEIERTRE